MDLVSLTPQENQQLMILISDAKLTNYLAVAAFVILLFEHFTTLQEECDYVWRTPNNLSGVLYIWIRYFSLFATAIAIWAMCTVHVKNQTCTLLLYGQVASSLIIVQVVTADCVLAPRVWILYGQPKTMLYFFGFLILAEATGFIYVGYRTVSPLRNTFIHLGSILPGCYSQADHRILAYYALPEMSLSVIMFAMTVYKCRVSSILSRDIGIGRTPIVTIFLRDGLLWFVAVLAISVVKLILWHGGRPTLVEVPIVPATALVAVIGARVLLNIKRLAAPSNDATLQSTSASMNGDVIVFAAALRRCDSDCTQGTALQDNASF